MPNSVEYGTLQFDNSKVGDSKDYLSTANYDKPKSSSTVLPSGQVIEMPKKKYDDRAMAGFKSVPQNFYTIGKDAGEAVSQKDANLSGNYKQSELKKDIIISPLGAITEHVTL